MKTKLWIARDKDGELYLYDYKPKLDRDTFVAHDISGWIKLNKNSHPEITFENSPQQIEI